MFYAIMWLMSHIRMSKLQEKATSNIQSLLVLHYVICTIHTCKHCVDVIKGYSVFVAVTQ